MPEGLAGYGPCGPELWMPNEPLGKIVYSGDDTILSASVINSMLQALSSINGRLAKLQIIGNAITCFANNGGAWVIPTGIWYDIYITDIFTWLVGAIIWVAGFMLIIAVAYYLLDISFKIGFAVIALPIMIGLWPFNMTKGKITACMSIIMKAAATYACLAITANYTVYMLESVLNDKPVTIDMLIGVMEKANANSTSMVDTEVANSIEIDGKTATSTTYKTNVEFVKDHISLFSTKFILILFALIYGYKLIGSTVKDIVNKFFPDNMFGDSSPMHSKLTAATKWAKDKAMVPVGWARDVAVHQSGRLAGAVLKKGVNAAAHPQRTARGIAGGIKKGIGALKKGAKWASEKMGGGSSGSGSSGGGSGGGN